MQPQMFVPPPVAQIAWLATRGPEDEAAILIGFGIAALVVVIVLLWAKLSGNLDIY